MTTTRHILRSNFMPGVEAEVALTVHNHDEPLVEPVTVTPGDTAIVVKFRSDQPVETDHPIFDIVAVSSGSQPRDAMDVLALLSALLPVLSEAPEPDMGGTR